MIDLIVMATLGVILGIIAGILPGIHSNLLATAVVVWYHHVHPTAMSGMSIAILIYTLALTNTFVSFIPSTYLGVPDAETALSVLPAHQYLLEGKGHEAVLLSFIGAACALLVTIITLPLFALILKPIYAGFKPHIPILLLIIACTLILREKSKFFAMYTFLAAGILGIMTLNMQRIKEPLLPLLTGLFGMPSLLISIFNKEQVSEQRISFPTLPKKMLLKTTGISLITGSLFSFLPSLGPSQAAVFSSLITKDESKEGYLMLMGALNTVSMIMSVITFYSIQKARNGAIVAIVDILKTIDLTTMIVIIAITLLLYYPLAGIMILLSKKFSLFITRINYQAISIGITVMIAIISFIISGPWSILVLITATAVGFIPIIKNVSRNHLMGSLMLSTVLWYLL